MSRWWRGRSRLTQDLGEVRGMGGHLTVVGTVYHQGADGDPVAVDTRWERDVQSDEQPYVRRTKVGEAWHPVDGGWIDEPGLLVITNEGGPPRRAQPTTEEAAQDSAKVMELGVAHATHEPTPFGLILPGESQPLHPHRLDELRIRCRSGEARYTIRLFPL